MEIKYLNSFYQDLESDAEEPDSLIICTQLRAENLVDYYKNADGKTKKKVLGCIFSEKLILEKGKVATYEFTKPILVLLNTSNVFKNLDIKKEVKRDLFKFLAPLTAGSCNLICKRLI
ncbi:MAG TPA: hypothetical protein VEP89_00960 [Draconibacterium sp.]|nr:hypothetical protein [Draconibacterium sp.]